MYVTLSPARAERTSQGTHVGQNRSLARTGRGTRRHGSGPGADGARQLPGGPTRPHGRARSDTRRCLRRQRARRRRQHAHTAARPGTLLFTVIYAADRVVPAGRYAVRARIVDGATTLFESAKPVRVLTQGTGSVASITLVQAGPSQLWKRRRVTPSLQTRPPRLRRSANRRRSRQPPPTPTPAAKANAGAKTNTDSDRQSQPPAPKATPTTTPTPKPAEAPKATPAEEPKPAPKQPPDTETNAGLDCGADSRHASRDAAPGPCHHDATPLAFAGAEWTMTEINAKPVRPASKTHRRIFLIFDEGHRHVLGREWV